MRIHLGRPDEDLAMCGLWVPGRTVDKPEVITCSSCIMAYQNNREWYHNHAGTDKVDYRELLLKYINHIRQSEGSAMIEGDQTYHTFGREPYFTDDEWVIMKTLRNEAHLKDRNHKP